MRSIVQYPLLQNTDQARTVRKLQSVMEMLNWLTTKWRWMVTFRRMSTKTKIMHRRAAEESASHRYVDSLTRRLDIHLLHQEQDADARTTPIRDEDVDPERGVSSGKGKGVVRGRQR